MADGEAVSTCWVEAIAFFLAVSILFYCIFGGADFGGGMLEAFAGTARREEQRKVIAHAIGPVWEANHVWLILAVVILFTGFPKAYSALSVTFHIPLTLMLIGIVLRGCAFTFRHYDAVRDDSQRYYSAIFIASSFLTPLMLGIVAGGMLLGASSPPEAGFYVSFVRPWANLFCFAVGVFTCVLFAFLAAVYLVGETQDAEIKRIFARRALVLNALAILVGIAVFAAAELEGLPLARLFAERRLSLGSMIGATVILLPLWIAVRRDARSCGENSRGRSGGPGSYRLVPAAVPDHHQFFDDASDDLHGCGTGADFALLALCAGRRVGDYLPGAVLFAEDFQIA